MKKLIGFAALLAITPASAIAQPVAESLSYRAYIGGLPLGDLNLKIAMDDSRYATEASFDITSLLSYLLDTDARASSNGALQDGMTVPKYFDYWVRDGKKERNTEMSFDAQGNPSDVRAKPEFDKRSYDVSSLAEVKGAIDPATAIVQLSAPRAGPCDLEMTIFDGRKLHKISLGTESGTAEKPLCKGRYERLAGFKSKYMTPERRAYGFEAELKQIAPDRWRPNRIWAKTKFGHAVAVLQ